MSLETQLDELIAEVRKTNALVAASLASRDGEWLTVSQAAAKLGLSTDTIRRKIASKELASRRIGRSVRVSLTSG